MTSLAHPSAPSQSAPAEKTLATTLSENTAGWDLDTWETFLGLCVDGWRDMSPDDRWATFAHAVRKVHECEAGGGTPEMRASWEHPTGRAVVEGLVRWMYADVCGDIELERKVGLIRLQAELTARMVVAAMAPAPRGSTTARPPIEVSEIDRARARKALKERGYVVNRKSPR